MAHSLGCQYHECWEHWEHWEELWSPKTTIGFIIMDYWMRIRNIGVVLNRMVHSKACTTFPNVTFGVVYYFGKCTMYYVATQHLQDI